MDKVLVTGGTGFVGKWLQRTAPPNLRVAYIGREEYNLRRWKFHAWDAIVHLANISPVEVLEHALKFDSRVLYCSSGIVYHDENDCEYRQNKIAWEQECLDSGADVVIARLFTFYGEGLDDGKAITQFEKAERERKPITIWGDGTCTRSYMHGGDMAKWMWTILLRGERGQAYDVGDDTPVTMLDLAKRYSEDIIFERDKHVAMPTYLPVDTAKTRKLLE